MKYIIERAQCKFSNGSTKVFRYDIDNATEQNTCNNIEVFRVNLKRAIEAKMKVTVLSVLLTYEDRSSRK